MWRELEALWQAVLAECREAATLASSGRPFVSSDFEARAQLLRLAEVPPREVIETALAMFMLREFTPQRFRSEDAFLFQLVRRVRALSDVNAFEYYDPRARRNKRVYRDLRPAATRAVGQFVIGALGRAGLYIARRERERLEQTGRDRQALDNALAELK